MRMRRKKNRIPRMERCAAIQEKQPYDMPGRWRERLTPDCPLYLEIGCGKGTFTVETAAAHPEVLFVAVERVPDCLLLAMEKVMARGLRNVVFVCDDAARLEEMFAPGEVDRIYLNFSDPWPKDRHAKRRLTSGTFLARYQKILTRTGRLEFKTDNRSLFEFSLESVEENGWRLIASTNDLHHSELKEGNIMTEYEERFSAMGNPIYKLIADQGTE